MTISHDLLRLKLAESLALVPPALTRRDVHLPGVPGKAFGVIGVRTVGGFEVDFLAHRAGETPLLIQACLESEGDETWERELRALKAAAPAYPGARPFLITLDAVPPRRPLPDGLTWASAAHWLLEAI